MIEWTFAYTEEKYARYVINEDVYVDGKWYKVYDKFMREDLGLYFGVIVVPL